MSGAGIYLKSRDYVAPVLHAYVNWVLEEAGKRGIKTLYFLARDGYVLWKTAQMLCCAGNINISCRYLYCSRASLRMPSYHLIGEEAYDLIFLGGCHVTAGSFFERAGIPQPERGRILAEAGAGMDFDMEQELDGGGIAEWRERLAGSRAFRDALIENSKKSYQAAVGYLRQEGLLGAEHTAVVDSGWTGSMQRSLRQLLESAGFKGKLTGFYFGLFQKPKEPRDGEYLPWYFAADTCMRNKILFCNNLLECFLSAPHGMTAGYGMRQGGYFPVLKEALGETQLEFIQEQARGILDGAKKQMESGKPLSREQCGHILHRLMARPTREEALLYGKFRFCDDTTEGYLRPLADESQAGLLKDTLLPLRLLRKICGRGRRPVQPFWAYGTIALVKNPVKRSLYRLNEYACQWLRMALR